MKTVLAVNSIPLSPKATTSWELQDGEDLERKELGWKRAQGKGNRKGKFIFELYGCCQAVWSIRLCPALDFHANIPFDKSPLESGAL